MNVGVCIQMRPYSSVQSDLLLSLLDVHCYLYYYCLFKKKFKATQYVLYSFRNTHIYKYAKLKKQATLKHNLY